MDGNSATSPSAANHKPHTSRKASAASTKPTALSAKTSPVTANARPSPKLRSGPANAKPRAANSGSIANNDAKVPGTPKPKPGPTKQIGPAELDAIHRKAIQSIDAAGKAMAVARANVESAKSSKEDRNKVVAKANEVVGALLTPSRHVVNLLSGLSALFPPCKQVSSTLAALIKHNIGRHEKDVRVAIVHFDLARALVHIGSLNRKSRPTKTIGDPLSKLLMDFKGVTQEFSQFCESYYETRGPESALKHLRHWKCNKDSLDSFAGQIAQLKKSLTDLLSQQTVQHPGKHTDALAQIESRLEKNRAFYATISDANEEIAEAFLSKQLKQGGEASVRLVQDGRLLKQFAGTLGEGLSSAIKKTTASTLKQVHEQVAKTSPDAKTSRFGVRAAFASKLGKLVSNDQQSDQVDTKSGSPRPPERIHKQDQAPMTTRAPASGQRTDQQQKKRTNETLGKLQTSLAQGQQFLDTVNSVAKLESQIKKFRGVAGDKGKKPAKGSVRAAEVPENREGTVEQGLGDNSLFVYEYADGDLEGDNNDDQGLHYLQGDEEIAEGLGVDGEYEGEDGDAPEDGDQEGGADYGDPEQEDGHAGSEPEGDDEGDQVAYFSSEDDSGDGRADYEGAEQDGGYDGSEPEGDDEGDKEAYCPQDGDGFDGVDSDADGGFGLGDFVGGLADNVDVDDGGGFGLGDFADGLADNVDVDDAGGIVTDFVEFLSDLV